MAVTLCFPSSGEQSHYLPCAACGRPPLARETFAASIAVELRCKGVDVCVVHPSPVASHFYQKVEHKIDSMESFKKLAVDPSELPREIFASIGRCVLRDVGNTAVGMRLGVALLPYGALAHIIALVAPFLPDYVENDKKRGQV